MSWALFPLLSLAHSKGLGKKQPVPVAVGRYHWWAGDILEGLLRARSCGVWS